MPAPPLKVTSAWLIQRSTTSRSRAAKCSVRNVSRPARSWPRDRLDRLGQRPQRRQRVDELALQDLVGRAERVARVGARQLGPVPAKSKPGHSTPSVPSSVSSDRLSSVSALGTCETVAVHHAEHLS